jgi:hypothetical protein
MLAFVSKDGQGTELFKKAQPKQNSLRRFPMGFGCWVLVVGRCIVGRCIVGRCIVGRCIVGRCIANDKQNVNRSSSLPMFLSGVVLYTIQPSTMKLVEFQSQSPLTKRDAIILPTDTI